MPVAFFAGRLLLLHPLGVLIEGLDLYGVPVMEFPLDQDLEDCLAFLLDLVRDRFRDQVERDAFDLFGSDCRLLLFIGHRLPPRGSRTAAPRNSGWSRSAI